MKTLRNLMDITNKHLSVLRELQLPVEQYDALLVYIISKRIQTNMGESWKLNVVIEKNCYRENPYVNL